MKTLICIPCMDMMHTGFVTSLLSLKLKDECRYAVNSSSLIYDSRNSLAKMAVNDEYDRILWLDSDMQFEPYLLQRLSARMDEGLDFVSGVYYSRRPPSTPIIYTKVGYLKAENGDMTPKAVPFLDYPDGLIEIEGAGFGAVLMSVKMVRDVAEKYGLPFSPILGFGEDLSFCLRARELGYKLYADTTIQLGHIGQWVYRRQT